MRPWVPAAGAWAALVAGRLGAAPFGQGRFEIMHLDKYSFEVLSGVGAVWHHIITCLRWNKWNENMIKILGFFNRKFNFGAERETGAGYSTMLGAPGRVAYLFGAARASGGPKMFRGCPEPRSGPKPGHPKLIMMPKINSRWDWFE